MLNKNRNKNPSSKQSMGSRKSKIYLFVLYLIKLDMWPFLIIIIIIIWDREGDLLSNSSEQWRLHSGAHFPIKLHTTGYSRLRGISRKKRCFDLNYL